MNWAIFLPRSHIYVELEIQERHSRHVRTINGSYYSLSAMSRSLRLLGEVGPSSALHFSDNRFRRTKGWLVMPLTVDNPDVEVQGKLLVFQAHAQRNHLKGGL